MLFLKIQTEKVPSRRHFVLVYAIFVLGEVVGFVHTIITKKKKNTTARLIQKVRASRMATGNAGWKPYDS